MLAVLPACVAAQVTQVPSPDYAKPLDGKVGDAVRGRALVANRLTSQCLLCHQVPIAEVPAHLQGDISTNLAGAGARWTAAELRLRIADARRLNPETVMPSYHRVQGLSRVGSAWKGKPILDAQQIEDVVAYVAGLK